MKRSLIITIAFVAITLPVVAQDTMIVVGEMDATKILQTYTDRNYGAGQTLHAKDGIDRRVLVKFTDIADSIGVGRNITKMVLRVHTVGVATAGYLGVYEILKPWFEGTSDNSAEEGATCWEDWYYHADAGEDSSWQTGGIDSASDSRPQNRSDGTDADRTATAMDSVNVSAGFTYYDFSIDTALANDWYDETKSNFGVLLMQQNNYIDIVLGSDDDPVDSQKVRMIIIHEALPAGYTQGIIIGKIDD